MNELDLLRKENRELKDSNAILKHRYAQLLQEKESLLAELQNCHDDTCQTINMLSSAKKDIRRYEVQISSLKSENATYKNRRQLTIVFTTVIEMFQIFSLMMSFFRPAKYFLKTSLNLPIKLSDNPNNLISLTRSLFVISPE